MTILKIFIVILFFFLRDSSARNDICYVSRYEPNDYLCPMRYAHTGGFSVRISPRKEVVIECEKLQRFRMDFLPDITYPKIKLLLVRHCPLPEPGFKEILDRFRTQEIREIEYEYRRPRDQNVTKDHFKDLTDLNLKYLTLASNGYEDIDEDIFENTPNLIGIELMENNFRTLKPNLFRNISTLQVVDVSMNRLETLPPEIFRSNQKLQELRLHHNKLTNVDELFKGLHKLDELELKGNRIEKISEDAFQDLQNLVYLNLGYNQLRELPRNLFRNNHRLKALHLYDNPHLQLVDYLFANISSLQEIDLARCQLTEIPEHVFENCDDLRLINFEDNYIEKIPDKFFDKLTTLEIVNLGGNRLKTIENLFNALTYLRQLSLQNSRIERIEKNTFSELTNLEELNLANTSIKYIHPRAFVSNDLLQTINLAQNRYSFEGPIFKDLKELVKIDLSNNKISQVGFLTLFNKPKLQLVDLRGNPIEIIRLVELQGISNLNILLDYNKIKYVDFSYVDHISGDHTSKISLSNNPLHCDCHNYDLVKFLHHGFPEKVSKMFKISANDLTCGYPKGLQNVPLREIPVSYFLCPLEHVVSGNNTGCPGKCLCFWGPANKTISVDCSNQNLTTFPEIKAANFPINFEEIEVDLTNNSLVRMNPEGYDKVTMLYLSYNKLVTIDSVPKDVKVLNLDNNRLTYLNSNILRRLNSSSLKELTLGNNSWDCVCGTEELASFIRQNSKLIDSQDVYCHNSTTRLIDLSRKDLCHDFVNIIITVISSIFFLLALAALLYYRYQKQIKIWLYAHNWCLLFVAEEDLDKDRLYDAFISYSHEDESYVADTLVPGLESGPQPFKLCLHYRDWIPGELITTHIMKSVKKSKRTIIILSENFLKSTWGKTEFQQAHSEAMAEGRVRLIVILYGEVDMARLDDEMKTYLRTNTYIAWNDRYFWDKLRYAMPHNKVLCDV